MTSENAPAHRRMPDHRKEALLSEMLLFIEAAKTKAEDLILKGDQEDNRDLLLSAIKRVRKGLPELADLPSSYERPHLVSTDRTEESG